MSVSYTSIFEKYNAQVEDSELLSRLTDQEYTELLDLFLSKAKSIYFKLCTKDLTDVEKPVFHTEDFVYSDSNEFIISQYPVDPNEDAIELVCRVNEVDITTYTFDAETLKFTITSVLTEDDDVQCGYNFFGQFNEDLDDEEQFILAEGCKLVWTDRQLYKEKKLRDRLGNKDYPAPHSPANLIDKLSTLKNDTLKQLKSLVVDYSFNKFKGFN